MRRPKFETLVELYLILIPIILLLSTLNFTPSVDSFDHESFEMDQLILESPELFDDYSGDIDCSELNECDF